MGLFNFFRKNNGKTQPLNGDGQPDIPKELFIEERDPQDDQNGFSSNAVQNGIDSIYSFLQGDYETKGYSDALTNPEDSYKNDNIKLIRLDLQILIQKAYTYYQDMTTELDLHIDTRSRAGLVDLVQELQMRKKMIVEHVEKVKQIKDEIEHENGISQRIILSYQRGFMRGLSALTQSKVLSKNLS